LPAASALSAAGAVPVASALPQSAGLTRARIQPSNAWLKQADPAGFTVQFVTDNMANLDYAETMFQELE